MSFPLRIIDLKDSIYRPVAGSFRQVAEDEISGGSWASNYRSTGPRQMRWVCDMEMQILHDDGDEDRRATWDVAIARLMGGPVAMRLFHPGRTLPRGVGAGVYRVGSDRVDDGAYLIGGTYHIDGVYSISGGSTFAYVAAAAPRYAESVQMRGLKPSATVLRAGDLFGLGDNLYMVTEDCISNGSGECTVPFVWRLWKPALAGDRISFQKPTARFVLISKDGGAQRFHGVLFGQASLQAIEIPVDE